MGLSMLEMITSNGDRQMESNVGVVLQKKDNDGVVIVK